MTIVPEAIAVDDYYERNGSLLKFYDVNSFLTAFYLRMRPGEDEGKWQHTHILWLPTSKLQCLPARSSVLALFVCQRNFINNPSSQVPSMFFSVPHYFPLFTNTYLSI
jgi:hypothetical protein